MSKSLKEKILSQLAYHRDCWFALASPDAIYLQGKIEAMDIAIRIVKAEFDKESEVKGE